MENSKKSKAKVLTKIIPNKTLRSNSLISPHSTGKTIESDCVYDIENIDEDNLSLKDIFKLLKVMHNSLNFMSKSHDDFNIAI